MRILLLNQFFLPNPAPTGQLLADLARELAGRGHSVHVICASSHYETRGEQRSPETTGLPPGIQVQRIPALPFSRSALVRLASWSAFLGYAFASSALLPRFDLVLAMTTPPGLGYAGLPQLWRGARLWIWEMDLYPDVATAVGTLRAGSWAARALQVILDWPRRRATGVITLGECMRDCLRKRIPDLKLHVSENWADGSRIPTLPIPSPANGKLRILYSGNLGMAHEIETIGAAMLLLRDFPKVELTVAGGGTRKQDLESFCLKQGLSNVRFEGFSNEAEFTDRLARSHIGLVILHRKCAGVVVPSKMYSLLAAGRPFFFIGPEEATPARLIRQYGCGWHVKNGNADAVADILKSLAESPEQLRVAATRARELFEAKYDMKIAVARLADLLT